MVLLCGGVGGATGQRDGNVVGYPRGMAPGDGAMGVGIHVDVAGIGLVGWRSVFPWLCARHAE